MCEIWQTHFPPILGKNLNLTNHNFLHNKGLKKCFPSRHVRPNLGILSLKLRKLYRVAFCHPEGGLTPLFLIMSRATLEVCTGHKVTVATGPSAHGLRWTKLCSLD